MPADAEPELIGEEKIQPLAALAGAVLFELPEELFGIESARHGVQRIERLRHGHGPDAAVALHAQLHAGHLGMFPQYFIHAPALAYAQRVVAEADPRALLLGFLYEPTD